MRKKSTLKKSRLTVLLFVLLLLPLITLQAQATWDDPGPAIISSAGASFLNSTLLEVNGTPAMAYTDGNANYSIKFRTSSDSKGMNWPNGSSNVYTVDSTVFAGLIGVEMTIINGNPAITSVVVSQTEEGYINYTRAGNASGTTWNSTVTVVTGISPPSNQKPIVNLKMVNGHPAIAYYNTIDENLYFVRANDANGNTWGTPVLVDSQGNVGDWLSMEVVDGQPAISYQDVTNGDLKYVRATRTNGNSWATPITVASAGIVGLHTSMEIIDGFPAIAYGDFTNKDLMYVRATNSTGSSWGTPVAAATTLGESINLLVVDGQPAIGYYTGFGDQDLRYVYATNSTGSSWWPPTLIDDGSAAMGNTLSMAIIDGHPAISYQDFTNSDLKYVRAGTFIDPALPVSWTLFEGELSNKGVDLQWQTANEEKNAGFEIQRSENGVSWQTLDFVAGAGTTQETQHYEYTDPEIREGIRYYRLKQIDYDGAFNYSQIVTITIKDLNESPVKIFPTLAKNEVHIEGGQGLFAVFNVNGQQVIPATPYVGNHVINTRDLPEGQYFLRMENGGNTTTTSFLKSR